MEFETVTSISDGMYLSLMMIKVVMVMFILLAIAGFAVYLAGIAWLCFEEKRRIRDPRRMVRLASPPTTWNSAPRLPDLEVRAPFVNKRRVDFEAPRAACALRARAASTPPA
jgi:hypothetical protein